jgi:hypothetical protein
MATNRKPDEPVQWNEELHAASVSDIPLAFPPVVMIDTREQRPFDFHGLRADARNDYRPLKVTTLRGTLRSGDYSLAGFEDCIALERKSLADLYGTIGQGRDRFVRELERLNELSVAGVICECDWDRILREPPPHTKLLPKVVFRSILAWTQRFPRVHWWMMPSRELAMATAFRALERFWLDSQAQQKEEADRGPQA